MTAIPPATAASPDSRSLMASIEERANLAGTNMMELLLFKVGSPETYGINVFKVKEVIRLVDITGVPASPNFVSGMVSLRGELVSVINLIAFCGYPPPAAPPVMIVTEFSRTNQAFLVESVETIIRINWSDIHPPPPMLAGKTKLTGVTRLADGRLASILDVEQVLHAITGKDKVAYIPETFVADETLPANIKVFYADDSAFARAQLQKVLETMKVGSDCAENGVEAWVKLEQIAATAAAAGERVADTWPVIITDIEMPQMDGFKLTKLIKGDPRFAGVKVLVHSSMSGSSNKDKGLAMGADGFLSKFNPDEVLATLQAIFSERYKSV
jgi:two-component system chemotaxis response regulator CheV